MGSSGVGVGGGPSVLARGGVPVLVLLMGVRLPGLGDGLPFLLARLGWGGRGIQGVCLIRVGFGEGAGVLVLRSPWGALSFGRFSAWGALSRGTISVLVLLGGGVWSWSLGRASFPVGVLVLLGMLWLGVVLLASLFGLGGFFRSPGWAPFPVGVLVLPGAPCRCVVLLSSLTWLDARYCG